jgi:membrane-associated phospholipid phosphatase
MLKRLLELDAQWTARLWVAESPGKLRSLAVILAHSGDSWFWLAGLALLWLLGTEFWKARALAMCAAILVTAVVVLAIKFTIKRRRPEGEWGEIYRKTDPHSFPSGHATRAVLLAVMAAGMGPAWFAVVLGIWAPMVILARVAMGVHYLTDVLAGAVLGIVMGGLALAVISRLSTLLLA